MKTFTLEKSPRAGKKWRIISDTGKKVDFGAENYQDLTMHKDEERKNRYISRHQARENWDKSGIETAGFWSRWLLWNLPSMIDSIHDIEKRFNVKINYKNIIFCCAY